MKKLTSLLTALCLSTWMVGCAPEATDAPADAPADTPADTTEEGGAGAEVTTEDAPAEEAPAEEAAPEGGSTTEN